MTACERETPTDCGNCRAKDIYWNPTVGLVVFVMRRVRLSGGGGMNTPLRVLPPRTSRDEPTIQAQFEAFDAANPQVYRKLVELAARWRHVHGPGARVGIGMLWEVMRWELSFTTAASHFKLNNDWRSRYARKLIADHPELASMFETRRLRAA